MSTDRADASRQRRALVEAKLNQAYQRAHGAESGEELREANNLLGVVLEMMKAKTRRMLREDHDACWNRWLEVKETIKYRREEIANFNYSAFRNDAYEAKGLAEQSPQHAKQKVRAIQQAMRGCTMERAQFDEIRAILDDVWTTASAAQHDEWEQKQQAWRERMRDGIAQKRERIQKNREVIAHLEEQIDHCKNMLQSAKSPEFEGRVQGWIDEKYEKIRDIEQFTTTLEEQVRDIDDKLQ